LTKKNKSVLVTGSTKGIGHEIATIFKQNNYKVVINGRNRLSIEDENKINKKGFDYLKCDFSITNEVSAASDLYKERYGELDVLICNVGGSTHSGMKLDFKSEWDNAFCKNFFSTINAINYFKNFFPKNTGKIICVSSICGLEHIPGAPITYSVSKAALNAFVREASVLLAQDGISINAVAPGHILFNGSVWDAKLKKDFLATNKFMRSEISQKKFGKTRDVAELVYWLSSDSSDYITGTIIKIDGGATRS
jgi:3-oxoacyl-[acyl-carrier protein] reductase